MIPSVEWATCPYCGCLISGWYNYPASVLTERGRDWWSEIRCPGAYPKHDCGKVFLVQLRMVGELIAEKIEGDGR